MDRPDFPHRHTFSYDGQSFNGLLTGKRAYVLVAYGAGGYVNGGPFSGADFVQPYLKFVLNFLGVGDVVFIPVEATTSQPAKDDMSAYLQPSLRAVEKAVDMATMMAA